MHWNIMSSEYHPGNGPAGLKPNIQQLGWASLGNFAPRGTLKAMGPCARLRQEAAAGKRGPVHWIAFLVLVLAAAYLRLNALDADPVPELSGDVISDEAWWAHNARNHALFGRFVLDDFNQGLFASPLHTAMVRLSFWAGGVSLQQVRLVSAVSSTGTVALLGLLLWREWGAMASLLAMSILGGDSFALSYDRSGFVEPLPTFLMTLSSVLILAREHRTRSLLLAGIVSMLAFFAKANAVYFIPVPLLFLLTQRTASFQGSLRGRWALKAREMAIYVAGVLGCFSLWLFVFIIPNWSEYVLQNGRLQAETAGPLKLTLVNLLVFGLQEKGGVARYSGFLKQALLPLGLASLWAVYQGLRVSRRGVSKWFSGLSRPERLATLWIAAQIPYFIAQMNGTDRRYYAFLVPLTILGVAVLIHTQRETICIRARPGRLHRLFRLIPGATLIMLPTLLYLRLPIVEAVQRVGSGLSIGDRPGISLHLAALVATTLCGAGMFAVLGVVLFFTRRFRVWVFPLALIVLWGLLPIQLTRVARTVLQREYTMRQAGQQVAALLGDQGRVVNGSALVFGTSCRSLILLDRRWCGYPFFGRGLFPSFNPTHLASSGELGEAEFAQHLRSLQVDWEYVPGSLHVYRFCSDGAGRPRFKMTFGEIRRSSAPSTKSFQSVQPGAGLWPKQAGETKADLGFACGIPESAPLNR